MNKQTPILAIETSGDLCSVALMINENSYSENNILQKHVHSQKLLSMIDNVLISAETELKDLSHIAVSIGPGSFTGLRIGLSVVKGLATGRGLGIVAVPTFEAIAFELINYINDGEDFIIANKVNVEELYFIKFNRAGDKYIVKEPLELIKKENFNVKAEDIKYIFGNYLNNNQFINFASPRALSIARWSYFFGKDLLTFDYDYIEPNYLKQFVGRMKK